ncbi:MAG: hypothetical protein WAW42_02270 [Candidatus Competibacteraceae bacterium]|jgi:hypothetical protein
MGIPTQGQVDVYSQTADSVNARLFEFDIARHELKPAHVQWLRQNVVPLLQKNGSLWITGLASPSDTERFNLLLSRRRTDEVILFLRQASPNNFKVVADLAVGESYARGQGVPNGTEDPIWRAVIISAWVKQTPPPPPPLPKPIPTISRKQGAVIWMEHDEKDKSLDSKPGNVSLKYNQQKAIDKTPPYFKYHQIPASHELIRIFTARSRSDFEVAKIASINSIYCHIFYQWGVRKRACHLIHGYWRDGAFNNNWPHLYELPDAYVKQWLDDPRTAIAELDKLVIRATSPHAYYIQGTTLGEPAPPPGFGW